MVNNLKEAGKLLYLSWNIDLDEVPIEQLDHYIAVKNFLTDEDEEKADAENLQKVQGYLEAFYHLCEVKDWNKSWLIVSIQLNTQNQEKLVEQLGIWGYYKEVVEILEILIGKISCSIDAFCYLTLGNAIQLQGEREIALNHFHKSLGLAQESGDKFLEGRVLINIGNVHRLKEDYEQAVVFFNKSLEITRKTNNRLWEAVALNFMALVSKDLEKAKKYYLESLAISSDIGNLQWQSNALTNLAVVYRQTGDYNEAQETLKRGLKLAEETGDRYAEGWAWYQLGLLRKELLDYSQAEEFLIRSKKLFEELGNPSGQEQVQRELMRLHQGM